MNNTDHGFRPLTAERFLLQLLLSMMVSGSIAFTALAILGPSLFTSCITVATGILAGHIAVRSRWRWLDSVIRLLRR